MFSLPSIVFCHAELAVDSVLLFGEQEQLDHENDQRALGGHVEAEREAEHRKNDVVERPDEHMDDEAEEEPDAEVDQHQIGGFSPMGFVVWRRLRWMCHGWRNPPLSDRMRP